MFAIAPGRYHLGYNWMLIRNCHDFLLFSVFSHDVACFFSIAFTFSLICVLVVRSCEVVFKFSLRLGVVDLSHFAFSAPDL